MANYCEGALAWIPGGPSGEHLVFAERGNYALRRKDLPACPYGRRQSKLVQMVINNNVMGACYHRVDCGFSANATTFYGVQVVPTFTEGDEGAIDQQTWLYKNAILYRRNLNGSYFLPKDVRKVRQPEIRGGIPPSAFNEAIKLSEANEQSKVCGEGMGLDECKDILALNTFNNKIVANVPGMDFRAKLAVSKAPLTRLETVHG